MSEEVPPAIVSPASAPVAVGPATLVATGATAVAPSEPLVEGGLASLVSDTTRQLLGWLGAFLLLSALVGALCAVFWVQVVELPTYTVYDDFSARTTERGLTEYFATDAWFSLIGLAVGVALGLIAWKWFSELGWPVAVIAAIGALAAGLVCWWVGQRLGPGPFDVRLAAANAGDVVPIQFLLRSPSALAVWVLGGVSPVLLMSALAPEGPEAVAPTARVGLPWRRRVRTPVPAQPDTSGEVMGRDIDPMHR